MKTRNQLMGTALRLALTSMALSSGASAQGLNGASGVNMNSIGRIINAPTITFPTSVTNTGTSWEFSATLQGFMVPAGQLTGLTTAGTAVSYEDLLPLKATSLSIATGAAGAAPTGVGTVIDATGIETNALSLLDSGTSTLAPLTVANGVLSLNGAAVGVGVNGNVDQALASAAAGHTMADIPGGTLTTLAGAGASITIAPFKMARTELTFGEWYQGLRWALQNGYGFAATSAGFWDNSGRATPQLSTDMTNAGVSPVVIKFAGAAANEISKSGGHSLGSAEHPVVGVSWFDAVKWCNARSEMDGFTPVYFQDTNANGTYDAGTDTVFKTGEPAHTTIIVNSAATGLRLPTEAEWEWAARGGNMAPNIYPWGTTSVSGAQASYQNQDYSAAPFRGRTSPVGSFPAGVNPYGLHDMAGNVWEWCADISPTDGTLRVVRGGGWRGTGTALRVSTRSGGTPAERQALFGFRIVRN